MKRVKSILAVVLCAALMLSAFAGCAFNFGSNDIVILFTGGAANEAESGIGYSGVAAYRRTVAANHSFTALVDCGDSLAGGSVDLVAKGAYAAEIMNEVGYDYYALGAKDTTLGTEALSAVAEGFDAKILSANAFAEDDTAFEAEAYAVEQFASRSVAYIGVTSPSAAGKDFTVSADSALVEDVRGAIEAAGDVDYVILLSNLGTEAAAQLVSKLSGVTAVLDVSASPVAQTLIPDENGKDVVYSSAGAKLQTVGQLVISASGTVSATNVVLSAKDEDTELVINNLSDQYLNQLDVAIATLAESVPDKNEAGIRIVQNREAPIGDLIADAYAAKAETQIGLVCADEISKGLEAGEVTLEDVMAVFASGRKIVSAEITGQQLLDALEFAVKNMSGYFAMNGQAYGTFEGFLQISGITYTINTNVATSVTVSEDGSLESIGDTRRLSNVKVKNAEGEFEAVDPAATYTVAGSEELLTGASNGNVVFADAKIINDDVCADYAALMDFIKANEDLSAYHTASGRIQVY